MSNSLKDKTALVCGGSDGLGFGAAKEMAAKGAEIILLGRTESKLEKRLLELKAINHQDHRYIILDFNDLENVQTQIENLTKEKEIHILINNTGGPAPGKLSEATIDQLSAAFATHVLASHLISNLVIPGMKKAGYGRIINITSTSIRQPIMGLGVSNTIRGAMGSWSKTMSLELAAEAITVNNILPGATKTGRLEAIIQKKQAQLNLSKAAAENIMLAEIPMGRFAEVAEVSKAIAFLASPDASYITGVNLQVDGGKIKSI